MARVSATGARPESSRSARRFALALGLLLTAASLRLAVAEELAVPAAMEAKLTGKVASYDRGFASRVNGKVVIAIVMQPSDPDSTRVSSQMQAAFRELGPIVGYPHEEIVIRFSDARALAAACARGKVSIVYLAPGLDSQVEPIAKALENSGVLSVASVLSYVSKGAILGFELVSGRPKLVINLASAKRQGLAFQAALLDLARVLR